MAPLHLQLPTQSCASWRPPRTAELDCPTATVYAVRMTKSIPPKGPNDKLTPHMAANLMETMLTTRTPPSSGPALNARKSGPMAHIEEVDVVPRRRTVYMRDEVEAWCTGEQPPAMRRAFAMAAKATETMANMVELEDTGDWDPAIEPDEDQVAYLMLSEICKAGDIAAGDKS